MFCFTAFTVNGSVNNLNEKDDIILLKNAFAYKLYACTFYDLEFISINPSTGEGTYIGDLDSGTIPFGLADRGNDIFLFDRNTNYVNQIDMETGDTLESINIGITDVTGEGAITFNSEGLGYLTSSFEDEGKLWSFDITGPSSTYIAAITPSMDGLDFRAGDLLYGINQCLSEEYELYSIDLVSGATTLVGPTGVMGNGYAFGGISFAPGDKLFAVFNDNLYEIDACTADTTYIGPIGFNNISGLTAVNIPNDPPTDPEISGPATGKPGKSYTYTFISTDPDGNQVSYYIDWGDETTSSWSEYLDSGTPFSTNHTWDEEGEFTVKAKTKDIYGSQSGWTEYIVTMPRNKQNINTLFLNLLKNHQYLFTVLQRLLQFF
jgi:hypothetical protein